MGKTSRCKELVREKRTMERKLKLLKKEFKELEAANLMIKDQIDLGNFEFQKAMEVFRIHYDGLCMKLEVKEMDFEDLLFRKSVVEGQLKACKITIDGLIQRIACLEQGRKVGYRAQEGDGREKVGELMAENRDLELGTQSGFWRKGGSELKEQLKVYKARCEDLSVKLEKKKMGCMGKYNELMSTNVVLIEKLRKYKKIYNEMKERIRRLDEERKAKCENDKRVQEKIGYLEKELKKKEINEKLKYAELIAVNRDLESGKERAEDEIKVLMKRIEDLKKGELNKELEAYRIKFHKLSVELVEKKMEGCLNEDNLKALMSEKSAVDDELKACKRTCDGLKDLIKALEEEQSSLLENEKKAQERINFLEAEMKKLRSDEGENYFELIMKTKDLESAKKGAEDENEILKKRVRDLETQVLKMEQVEAEKAGLEREFEFFFTKYDELYMDLEQKKRESVGVEDKRMCNKLKEQIKKMESDESEKYVKLKTENRDLEFRNRRAEEEVENWKKRFRELETKSLRLEEELSTFRCIDSQASGGLQCEDSYNDIAEKYNRNIKLQSETKCGTDGAHVDHLKIKEKMVNNSENILTSSFAGCNHPSTHQGNIDGHITGPASITSQSKPILNFKEEKEITPLESKVEFQTKVRQGSVTPTSGRIVDISDSKDEKELSPNHTYSVRGKETVHVSTGKTLKRSSCNEKDPESQKFFKRLCSDQGGEKYGSSYDEDTPRSSNPKRRASVVVTSESESEDDNTNSEDISSDSEDESKIHLAFDQVIETIKRNRLMESNWQFEADMLSSFEADSELCMKAVCALYRQQIPKEKLMKGYLNSNNKGFNKYDVLRGATLAVFLMDGNKEGDLKKSVKELELFDPKALEECKRLAKHYSKQLFTLYQNKEDPFFHPNSVGHLEHSASSGRM